MTKCLHCMDREPESGLYCSFCLSLKPELAEKTQTLRQPVPVGPSSTRQEADEPDQMQRFYSQPPRPPRDREIIRERLRLPGWIVAGLLLSLLGNAALAGFLWDTRRDFAAAEDLFDAKVAAAEEQLASVTAAAISQVPDVDAVKRDLADLEEKLFGFSGGGFRQDVIGSLEQDLGAVEASVTRLGFDLSGFKSCMNRTILNAFDSYNRASNSYYSGTYVVGRCY